MLVKLSSRPLRCFARDDERAGEPTSLDIRTVP
jgi:hypothetical protein